MIKTWILLLGIVFTSQAQDYLNDDLVIGVVSLVCTSSRLINAKDGEVLVNGGSSWKAEGVIYRSSGSIRLHLFYIFNDGKVNQDDYELEDSPTKGATFISTVGGQQAMLMITTDGKFFSCHTGPLPNKQNVLAMFTKYSTGTGEIVMKPW